MITVAQVMRTQVRSVHPDATVAEAIGILTECHTDGAPVVNDAGELVGMLYELALIDVVFQFDIRFAPILKYITQNVQAVGPTDSIARAAQLFALCGIRRLPVVEEGKLVGIITSRDLMNFVLQSADVLADPLVDLFPTMVLQVANDANERAFDWD